MHINQKLFSEQFRPIHSDEDLVKLCQEFSKYDPGYLCQSTYGLHQKVKEWMERLWEQYEPYADSHFLENFKRQFTQRSWELYLGSTLLNRNFSLGLHKNKGPDFDLHNKDGQRISWIEATAVTKGVGVDRVPNIVYGTVGIVPTEEITLRLASGLAAKYKDYCSYCEDGIISDLEPYVIAIDRSEIEHVDTMLPNILKVLFGIGDLALHMRIRGKPVENPENSWTYKPAVEKQNGEPIPMLFFEDMKHAGVSAIIYNKDSIINSPRDPKQMGENFVIVHNPLAKNTLPHGFFPFGQEYIAEKSFIKKIRDSKNYSRPDPFEHLDN